MSLLPIAMIAPFSLQQFHRKDVVKLDHTSLQRFHLNIFIPTFECICQLSKECNVHNKGDKTFMQKMRDLELQWHKHLWCNTSVRWPGPSILTGLDDTQSRVRYSQRRRIDSTKES